MSSDLLASIAAILLSLAFAYIPGSNSRWANLSGDHKRLIMLGLLLLVSLGALGLACSGLSPEFGLSLTCDRAGLIGLVKIFITAAIANQSTFAIAPFKRAVKVSG